MSTKIEFRCSLEERKKVEEKAKREGLSVGQNSSKLNEGLRRQ